ncbi:MAG TPA: superoxide dismutase [Fe] [Sulfurovum sp. UBA12169]|nr:MAG TPA: superoxide dismutase [Fe] [Sulfurovum sp. UBA12169]
MKHRLPQLPYKMDALAPYISEETLRYHHGKHHAGYVNKLNALIEGTEYEEMSLEQIIHQSDGAIFNNAAQTFNHNFYWHSLSPMKTEPSDPFRRAIEETFGSMDAFKETFVQAATGQFGSGWAWLVLDQHDRLLIETTSNAHTPIEHHRTPLFVCDVWEHAYYIDYRNERPKYVETFWDLINWDYASKIFEDKEHLKATTMLPICNNPDDPMCEYFDELLHQDMTSS